MTFFTVENELPMHALVEFCKEGCTAVVPMCCIVNTNTESLKQGESVKILWSNRKQYPAIYLLSGISGFVLQKLM